MNPSPERRTDPTGKLGLASLPLADQVPGASESSLLVEVDGTFDSWNDRWAVELLQGYVDDPNMHGIVFDTRRVESCGDHAIHLFTVALKAVHPRGGTVVVLPSPCIRESLRISGLESLFPLAADPAEASAILAAAGRALDPPAADLPREEEDGLGHQAVFEPLPDLPGGLVVRYSGTMDRQAGAWFYSLVLRRVEAGYVRLALDLSGLQWVVSPGIGHLSGILKTVKLRDGLLALFGIPPKIDEVILLLGLEQYFEIVDTEAEALILLRNNLAGLEEPAFPKVFKCPICVARTRAVRPMRGRCRTCKTLLAVDEHGMVFLG